ncbi:MAG: hypothetical protein Q9180_000991 [Flavoplaca navasiana]
MEGLPAPVLDALKFERSNWASGSVLDDPFYECPHEAGQATPGTLLRLERDVNSTAYLIPGGTALSKIVYQSEKLDGTPVPVSGFILWPYSARSQTDGYAVVAWAHGTSGADPDTAPSNHKNLWQHFLGPYQLALQGYVVVATDYAGLGVAKDTAGEPIMHEYLASPSQANDIVHSIKAAQEAFPEISKQFVVVGHSQGGGAAWSVAQREVTRPSPGYLGAIAISPYTSFLNEEGTFGPLMGVAMCRGIASSFPGFDTKEILTQEGEKRVAVMFQSHAGVAGAMALFARGDLIRADWRENAHVQKHGLLTSNGGKEIRGPLLVIHGESDPMNSPGAVKKAAEMTARLFPSAPLELVWLPEVTHAPALGASQRLWMDWICDRFGGVEVESCYKESQLASARPATVYHKEQNWYLETASKFYHTP